jgi:hypothetical protein
VQVVLSQHPGKGGAPNQYGDLGPSKTWRLTAIIVNHGAYTIRRVEVQFCIGNSLTPQHRYEQVPGFGDLPLGWSESRVPAAGASGSRAAARFSS